MAVTVAGVWATFYLLSTVLFFKWVFTSMRIAHYRGKTGVARTPEDKWNSKLPQPTAEEAAAALALQQRWTRIQENDNENLLWGVVVFGFSAIYLKAPMFVVLYTVFAFARISHTVCYAYSLQPFRSLSWILGLLTTLIAAIGAIVEAFVLV